MTLVSTGLEVEVSGSSERQRLDLGELLKSSITNFTVDFIPHMDEEEEVGVGSGVKGRVLGSRCVRV